jgi:hypothetical protein
MAWNNLNLFITVPFFCVSLLGLPGQRKKAKIHCVSFAQKSAVAFAVTREE